MAAKKRKAARWQDANTVLGTKRVICRGCGRAVVVGMTAILKANATRRPIRCHQCGGDMKA